MRGRSRSRLAATIRPNARLNAREGKSISGTAAPAVADPTTSDLSDPPDGLGRLAWKVCLPDFSPCFFGRRIKETALTGGTDGSEISQTDQMRQMSQNCITPVASQIRPSGRALPTGNLPRDLSLSGFGKDR